MKSAGQTQTLYGPDGQPIANEAPQYGPDGFRAGDSDGEGDPLLGARRMGQPRGSRDLVEAALQTGVIPWLLFLASSMLTMLLLGPLPALVTLLCGASTAGFLTLTAVFVARLRMVRAVSFAACGAAVALGSLAGLYNHDVNSHDYWAFNQHRQYVNVWPSEPAAAHRDASALVFAAGAGPDVRLSGSFTGAYGTYCVAPVAMGGTMDPEQGEIQYWAVGMDCCPTGKFFCGAARDTSARAGLVVYDRNHTFSGWVPRDIDMYTQAALMVAAKFGSTSAQRPIFLHWVKDLEAARASFLDRAWLTWFKVGLASLPIWLLISSGPAHMRQASQQAPQRARAQFKRFRRSGEV